MKKVLVILSLISIIGVSGAGPVRAIGIDFLNLQITDNKLSADVVVTDLGVEVVSAYDLAVGYNSSIMKASSVEFVGALGDPIFLEVIQGKDLNTAGLVKFKENSLLDDEELFKLQGGGEVQLATLWFNISVSDSILKTTAEAVVPNYGLEFLWGPTNEVIGRDGKKLIPAPVPEPATLLLLGAGLAGLAGFGRKKFRNG